MKLSILSHQTASAFKSDFRNKSIHYSYEFSVMNAPICYWDLNNQWLIDTFQNVRMLSQQTNSNEALIAARIAGIIRIGFH